MSDRRAPEDSGVEVLGQDSFEALAPEWESLALRTGASPFSRPGWVRSWWSGFGRGELRVFTCRRDSELTGVLPMARQGARLRSCSNAHTPLFDGVATAEEDFAIMLRAALREGSRGIVLDRLEASGGLSTAARRMSEEGDCSLLGLDSLTSSRIEPTLSWEEFEQGLSKSRRRNARRRLKKLAEMEALDFDAIVDSDAIGLSFEDFLRLEGSAWKVGRGTAIRQSLETRGFYEKMIRWAAEAGILWLHFFCVGDRRVAVHLAIEDGDRRWGLKVGFDAEFSPFAPGLIIQLEEIRSLLKAGRAFELGTGEEPLKRELRNGSWAMESVGLFPRSPRGIIFHAATAARMGAYRQARESSLLQRGRDAVRRRRADGSQIAVGERTSQGDD